MEWDAVFGRCFNLVLNFRIYHQKLSVGMVDCLTLGIVLTDCSRVQSELEQYARLVSANKQSTTIFLFGFPRLVIAGKIEDKTPESVIRTVKYRRNKTDTLAGIECPRSVTKRSSLMKHLSQSMLKLKL